MSNLYKETYNKIKDLDRPEFSSEYWQNKSKLISKEFCKSLPKDFLQNTHIKETMVAANEMKAMQQLGYIKSYWKDRADELLAEPDVGGLSKPKNLEGHSCNIINHVYFATKFVEKSKQSENSYANFVEIGGGFGTLGMVMKRIYPNVPYSIIDVPAITAIQKAYLGDLAAVESNDSADVINLVPLGKESLWEDLVNFPPDVLIAMWSIGEVAPKMNDWVTAIESKNFMVGTHNWKCGSFNQAARVYNNFSSRASYAEEMAPKNHLLIK